MTEQVGVLAEPGPSTQEEFELTAWMLLHGIDGAEDFLPQLDKATVLSHCQCSCASINFSIDGKCPQTYAMRILADYQWTDEFGRKFGVFVFEQDDLLAGLDLWSIDVATNLAFSPAAHRFYGRIVIALHQSAILRLRASVRKWTRLVESCQ